MTKSENKYKQLTRKQKYALEREQRAREENKVREDLVEGRNAVIELLK